MENKKRTYVEIGSGRLLDITVYLDNNLVYDGMVEDAPDNIKKLKYSEVEIQGKITYRAYSNMQ